MNIQPKTITSTKTVTSSFSFTTLNDAHITNDDPIRKTLRVTLSEALPPQVVSVTGSDYDALGQWTDDSLNAYIIDKYGLVTGQA